MKNTNDHATLEKRSRRTLPNTGLPQMTIGSSLLYFNPFARIIKSNAKYFDMSQIPYKNEPKIEKTEEYKENKKNDREIIRNSIEIDSNNDMNMNKIEERLIMSKFGVYQNQGLGNDQRIKEWGDLPRIPVKRITSITPDDNGKDMRGMGGYFWIFKNSSRNARGKSEASLKIRWRSLISKRKFWYF